MVTEEEWMQCGLTLNKPQRASLHNASPFLFSPNSTCSGLGPRRLWGLSEGFVHKELMSRDLARRDLARQIEPHGKTEHSRLMFDKLSIDLLLGVSVNELLSLHFVLQQTIPKRE